MSAGTLRQTVTVRIEDGRQAATGRQRPNHDFVSGHQLGRRACTHTVGGELLILTGEEIPTVIVHYEPSLLKVDGVDHFVESIVLVPIQIRGLTPVSRATPVSPWPARLIAWLTSGRTERHWVGQWTQAIAWPGSCWLASGFGGGSGSHR